MGLGTHGFNKHLRLGKQSRLGFCPLKTPRAMNPPNKIHFDLVDMNLRAGMLWLEQSVNRKERPSLLVDVKHLYGGKELLDLDDPSLVSKIVPKMEGNTSLLAQS
jgi:hypothetical protein